MKETKVPIGELATSINEDLAGYGKVEFSESHDGDTYCSLNLTQRPSPEILTRLLDLICEADYSAVTLQIRDTKNAFATAQFFRCSSILLPDCTLTGHHPPQTSLNNDPQLPHPWTVKVKRSSIDTDALRSLLEHVATENTELFLDASTITGSSCSLDCRNANVVFHAMSIESSLRLKFVNIHDLSFLYCDLTEESRDLMQHLPSGCSITFENCKNGLIGPTFSAEVKLSSEPGSLERKSELDRLLGRTPHGATHQ